MEAVAIDDEHTSRPAGEEDRLVELPIELAGVSLHIVQGQIVAQTDFDAVEHGGFAIVRLAIDALEFVPVVTRIEQDHLLRELGEQRVGLLDEARIRDTARDLLVDDQRIGGFQRVPDAGQDRLVRRLRPLVEEAEIHAGLLAIGHVRLRERHGVVVLVLDHQTCRIDAQFVQFPPQLATVQIAPDSADDPDHLGL